MRRGGQGDSSLPRGLHSEVKGLPPFQHFSRNKIPPFPKKLQVILLLPQIIRQHMRNLVYDWIPTSTLGTLQESLRNFLLDALWAYQLLFRQLGNKLNIQATILATIGNLLAQLAVWIVVLLEDVKR